MNAGDVSRQKDFLYRILVSTSGISELDLCVNSIKQNYVEKHANCHPTLSQMMSGSEPLPLVQKRALVMFCAHVEKSFAQYLMDREDVNNACLSQFLCEYLPKYTKQLLDGAICLDDFVANATSDYICG